MLSGIRMASRSDSTTLSALAMRAKASWGYPSSWLEIWREDLTLTPEYIESHCTLAAERDDRVVGVCVLEDHEDSWAIEHFWVEPSLQGQGLGRSLLNEALERAGTARPGKVRVLSDPYAEPFYVRMGASRVDLVPAPMPGAPDRALPLLEFEV